MRCTTFFSTLLALTLSARSCVLAKPHPVTNGQICTSQFYDVAIQTNRTLFDTGLLDQRNQSRTTDLLVDGALHQERIAAAVHGQEPYSATVRIHGTLCTPKGGASSTAPLHVLVHGIGFDASYWDINERDMPASEYSFVAAAAKYGISTFRFDRLGTGKSQRPTDGINEVQGAIEAAILGKLLASAKTSTSIGGRPWPKVVVVGHSYGSILAHAVSRQAPALIDGLVLTGFSANNSATPYYLLAAGYVIAKQARPGSFGMASSNWLITGSEQGRQVAFLYPPTVSSAGRELLARSEQPVSLGTFFTIPFLFGRAEEYKGPVQIVLADNDFIFALQENSAEKAQGAAAGLYPSSINATTYVPSNTGHAINVHNTASGVYANVLRFLEDNKLL